MGLVVAACHHKRIQVRSCLFEAKFHFSVFRGMFFPAALRQPEIHWERGQLPFIRRHTPETEWAASLRKRRRPAFGGKMKSVRRKSRRALLDRGRTQIVGDGYTRVAHGPRLRKAKNRIARIGGRNWREEVRRRPTGLNIPPGENGGPGDEHRGNQVRGCRCFLDGIRRARERGDPAA